MQVFGKVMLARLCWQGDTFQRSLGKGRCSAVWMVRLRVDVHTDTGMVCPSLVCKGTVMLHQKVT